MNPDSNQQSNSNPANYTVVPGDNLYDIARSNGVSLQQIEAANPQIANFDVIHPGDVINLPATSSAAPASSGSSYTVVPGDNLTDIAQSHGQSLQDIESANPQIANPDLIHPGDVINLGTGSTQAPATPAAPTDPTATPAPTDTSGGGTSSVTSPIPTTPGASVDNSQQTTPDSTGGTGTSSSSSTSTTDNSNPPSTVTGSGSTSSTTDTNQTPASPTTPVSSTPAPPSAGSIVSGAAPGDPTLLGDTSPQPMATQGAEMSGFPSSSSYSVAGSAQEVADVAKELGGAGPQGWPDAGGSTPQDVAKTVFEEPSHPSTDPLNINDKTDKPAG